MPGPKEAADALEWSRDAMSSGRYTPSVHFAERMMQRAVDFEDVFNAIAKATECIPFTNDPPRHGGTCWRIIGPDLEDTQRVALGVETYTDKKRRRCFLCTVFPKED